MVERFLTALDVTAIKRYLLSCTFDEKGEPWQDIADKAGVYKGDRNGKENVQFHERLFRDTSQLNLPTSKLA